VYGVTVVCPPTAGVQLTAPYTELEDRTSTTA
jgi:hypothetical protein